MRLAQRLGAWVLAGSFSLGTAACTHGKDSAAQLSARDRARSLIDSDRPEEALALLRQEWTAQPDDLDLARALTEAYVKTGRVEALIAELQSLNAKKPTATQHYMLGLSYFSRAADAGGPALKAFREAIALAPREAELHHRLGVALLESEQETSAVPSLEEAVSLAPDRARYLLPLAKAYARAGQNERAVAMLRELVRRGPTPPELSVARSLMGQLSDPFARFPRAAEAKLQEGIRALEELDMPQQAIVSFQEILLEYPDLAVVHALLGLAHQRLDDVGRAVEEFRTAMALAPRDAKNHLYLAELYQSRRRPVQALEHYRKAVEFNPLLDLAWFRLGDLLLERGEVDGAEEAFTLLTHLTPDSIAARGKLAAVHQRKKNYVAAERELSHVLERDPGNLEFQMRIGLVAYERWRGSSRPEERRLAGDAAEKWLRKVLEAQPDNALASRALQDLTQKR